jgi:hypothetical protein
VTSYVPEQIGLVSCSVPVALAPAVSHVIVPWDVVPSGHVTSTVTAQLSDDTLGLLVHAVVTAPPSPPIMTVCSGIEPQFPERTVYFAL